MGLRNWALPPSHPLKRSHCWSSVSFCVAFQKKRHFFIKSVLFLRFLKKSFCCMFSLCCAFHKRCTCFQVVAALFRERERKDLCFLCFPFCGAFSKRKTCFCQYLFCCDWLKHVFVMFYFMLRFSTKWYVFPLLRFSKRESSPTISQLCPKSLPLLVQRYWTPFQVCVFVQSMFPNSLPISVKVSNYAQHISNYFTNLIF